MASQSTKFILRIIVVAALMILAPKVDCRHMEHSFTRQNTIKHYSKRSHLGELWHHLGEPFRTIHSAYALLLGVSTKRQEGMGRKNPEKSSTEKTNSASPSSVTKVFPDLIPSTTQPSTSKDQKIDASNLKICSVTAPGSDPELEMRNMRQLETDACGRIETRIYGGEAAMPGEFPWITLIESEYYYERGKFNYTCGGSLISDRYVLTAAHCIKDHRYIVRSVVFGEFNTKTENDPCLPVEALYLEIISGQPCRTDPPLKVKIECTILHPKYTRAKRHPNDIALIRMEKPIQFTAYIEPVCLPVGDFNVRIRQEIDYHTKLTVVGWGMSMNESRTSVPMKVDIPLVDEDACRSWHPFMAKGKLCVGETNGRSACRGDSGGPLLTRKMMETNDIGYGEMAYTRKPRAIQVGVVSTGSQDCQEPSLFTYIPDYLPWILSNIKP